MKICFISDVQINCKNDSFKLHYTETIKRITASVVKGKFDMIVLLGDQVERSNASVYEIVLLHDFLKKLNQLKIPIVLVYGNHDLDKNNTCVFESLIKFENLCFLKESKKYTLTCKNKRINFYNWGYMHKNGSYAPEYDFEMDDANTINITLMHDTLEFIKFNDENKIKLADIKTRYTFSGHIHAQIVHEEANKIFCYPGSAITNNFSEGFIKNIDNNKLHGYATFEPFGDGKKINFINIEQHTKLATIDETTSINDFLHNYNQNDHFILKLRRVDTNYDPKYCNVSLIHQLPENTNAVPETIKMFEDEKKKCEFDGYKTTAVNVRVTSLHVKNYKSIGNFEIYFDDDMPIHLVGDNMKGKSTVFEAFVYCITGSTHVKANKAKTLQNLMKIKKNGNLETCVIVNLVVNDIKFKITREILIINGKVTEKCAVSDEALYKMLLLHKLNNVITSDILESFVFDTSSFFFDISKKIGTSYLYAMKSNLKYIKPVVTKDVNVVDKIQITKLKILNYELKINARVLNKTRYYNDMLRKIEPVNPPPAKRECPDIASIGRVKATSQYRRLLNNVSRETCMDAYDHAILNTYTQQLHEYEVLAGAIESTLEQCKVFESYKSYLTAQINDMHALILEYMNTCVKKVLDNYSFALDGNELCVIISGRSYSKHHLSGFQKLHLCLVLMYIMGLQFDVLFFDEVLHVSDCSEKLKQLVDKLFPKTKLVYIDHYFSFKNEKKMRLECQV